MRELLEGRSRGRPAAPAMERALRPTESDGPDAAAAPAVAVIQDGARLHYALPLALQREGMLGTMFTDWFVRPGSPEETAAAVLRRMFPHLGQRLAGRCCSELDSEQVVSSHWLALGTWLARLRTDEAPEAREARLSARFAGWVERQGWRGANCLMGFVRNIDPRLCEAASAARMVTVVDQMIAPAAIEFAEMRREAERWPGWAPGGPPSRPRPLIELERRTWQAADHVTCPSSYVREGLLRQGVSPEKISEIPYPIAAEAWEAVDRSRRTGPVTVGFVGAVGLRKGAPAVFELAGRFDPARVRFVMVGPVSAPPPVLAVQEGRVALTGPVPRSAIRGHLREFDVFLLPSACEGSAGAAMEAMASALPVVTTPNAGTLVRDGVDGFVRGCHDLDGLAEGLSRLIADADLRARMGHAARQRAEAFGIGQFGRSLGALLQGLLDREPSRP